MKKAEQSKLSPPATSNSALERFHQAVKDRPEFQFILDKSPDLPYIGISQKNYGAFVHSLKEDEEFRATARDNQWKSRRENGWDWQADVYDFISDIYGKWVGKGLTQADLKAVDEQLWMAFQKKKQFVVVPANLYLPTEAEARLAAINDPMDRQKLLIIREWERAKSAGVRQRARAKRNEVSQTVENPAIRPR